MSPRRQIARVEFAAMSATFRMRLFLPLLALCLCSGSLRAQSPANAVGNVEGADISVESTISSASDVGGSASGTVVSNGSIVTVHSGHARLTLFAGGQVEICGPAKFTMLQTNGAITLALNFGRVRVQLPVNSSLRVFTPTIIATPLDISGGARDVAVGLNLDDSLCVRATSGAIQLEHQFSGEKLIVPQAGEFFLNAGQLLPVAGTAGSCACDAASDSTPIVVPAKTPPPQYAIAITRPVISGQPLPSPLPAPDVPAAPATSLAAIPPAALQKPEAELDLQLLAQASAAHPEAAAPAKSVAPETPPPAPSAGSITTAASSLVYMAPHLAPPLDPGPDVILLIRQAQVTPEYEFSGHVNAPDFALALQHALGQSSAPTGAPAHPTEPKPEKKKGGFWASLKRAFGGGSGPQVE